jgi:hypothetical protein
MTRPILQTPPTGRDTPTELAGDRGRTTWTHVTSPTAGL